MRIRPSELPGPPGGRCFVGADHGGVPISLFLVDVRPGSGPRLHRHPYPEIFVIDTGQATFQINDSLLAAHAGDILIAPAGSAHPLHEHRRGIPAPDRDPHGDRDGDRLARHRRRRDANDGAGTA